MGDTVIGVTCCIDRGQRLRAGRDYYYVNRAYAQQLAHAGATPLLLGLDTLPAAAVELCSGLVITGGDDLPRSFGETTDEETLGAAEDSERISWERQLIDAFQQAQKPTLGICYGMQLINLHLGGTLFRSLRDEHSGALDHGGSGEVTFHATTLDTSSQLFAGLPETLETNSSHGQSVNDLAPGLRATAHASDGIIEALEGANLYGIEWHPETDSSGRAVYANFARLCENTEH